ncbi:hypothetical protein Ae168Ps1_3173c [Pseudonocardia sp. Ae168_Ps1]|nr:hypothetical protein Ae168Ps1_3173c [Pseudonocardia sp. Ae168_Ps1]
MVIRAGSIGATSVRPDDARITRCDRQLSVHDGAMTPRPMR